MQHSTGQPSVSDVLDDDVPDVPDEHEPVNGMYLLIGLCVLIFLMCVLSVVAWSQSKCYTCLSNAATFYCL